MTSKASWLDCVAEIAEQPVDSDRDRDCENCRYRYELLLAEGNVVGLLDGAPVGIAAGLLCARGDDDGLVDGRRTRVGVVVGLLDGLHEEGA